MMYISLSLHSRKTGDFIGNIVGSWCVVRNGGKASLEKIQAIDEEDDENEVSVMKSIGIHRFSWPSQLKSVYY